MLKFKKSLPIRRITYTLGGIFLFVTSFIVLLMVKVNIYLALILAWLLIAMLPAVIKPKMRVAEGMQLLLKDKIRAKAFAKTALIVGVFSLLANDSLRFYFWGISVINIIFAGIIAVRLYRSPQPQG